MTPPAHARLLRLMKHIVWLGVFASCATSPEAPLSNATLSDSTAVHSSRAQEGFISYGGVPLHKWTITLATTEGCSGDTAASVELNTTAGVTEIPLGTTMIRSQEMTTTLPSALLRYNAAPVISGSVTIDTASASYVTGSWTAQIMVSGAPTEVTATFGAPVCP